MTTKHGIIFLRHCDVLNIFCSMSSLYTVLLLLHSLTAFAFVVRSQRTLICASSVVTILDLWLMECFPFFFFYLIMLKTLLVLHFPFWNERRKIDALSELESQRSSTHPRISNWNLWGGKKKTSPCLCKYTRVGVAHRIKFKGFSCEPWLLANQFDIIMWSVELAVCGDMEIQFLLSRHLPRSHTLVTGYGSDITDRQWVSICSTLSQWHMVCLILTS